MGSIIGSFLNVCIHRMPRGHSIVKPRSRCYSCEKTIPWSDNIPILSYVILGGKCRQCGARFSPRYMFVELFTAIMFVAIWQHFDPATAMVYTVFACGLIIATFIDFEHYIIPDEITWGGVVAGIICSGFVPEIQGAESHTRAALWSLAGAGLGYGVLWGVVELGKLIFGIKKVELPGPTEIAITPAGIRMADETETWEEIFSRPTDTLSFTAAAVRLGERTWEQALVRVNWQELKVNEETFPLDGLAELSATTSSIYVPREAMGFGDVKFLAAIGAFLGPKAIFFVILLSSLTGSSVGLFTMAIGKKSWGMKLPYGPYLAFAALVWIFGGAELTAHYFMGFGR